MLASITNLGFVVAVAVVNLAMGFGIAMLVGRGPFSRHGRLNRRRMLPQIAATTVETVSHTAEVASPVAEDVPSAVEPALRNRRKSFSPPPESGNDLMGWVSTSPSDFGDEKAIPSFAGRIERFEEQLQKLIDDPRAVNGRPDAEKSAEWSEVVLGIADQLAQANAELCGDSGDASHEVSDRIGEALESLQARFRSCADDIRHATQKDVDLVESINALLKACQQARGAVNAVLFVQTQP